MKHENIIKTFKKYQKSSPKSKARRKYLRIFQEMMIYRTTKTENPETTRAMVRKVLNKHR